MCVFCKIIKGEIPSYKIYEDKDTFAFLDISPDYQGHTLVVPKVHCGNILDCSGDVLSRVIDTVKRVSCHYVANCGFNGVNIFSNNGSAAEQSVFHLHFHIVPRKENDKIDLFTHFKCERDLEKEYVTLKLN